MSEDTRRLKAEDLASVREKLIGALARGETGDVQTRAICAVAAADRFIEQIVAAARRAALEDLVKTFKVRWDGAAVGKERATWHEARRIVERALAPEAGR